MGKKVSNEVRMFGVLPSEGADPIPVGKIPDGGTQVIASGRATNQTTVIHTVTTNTVLYLSSLATQISNYSAESRDGYVYVRDGNDDEQYRMCSIHLKVDGAVIDNQTFFPPLEIPAGWDLVAESNGDSHRVTALIHGYEL